MFLLYRKITVFTLATQDYVFIVGWDHSLRKITCEMYRKLINCKPYRISWILLDWIIQLNKGLLVHFDYTILYLTAKG